MTGGYCDICQEELDSDNEEFCTACLEIVQKYNEVQDDKSNDQYEGQLNLLDDRN